MIVVDASFLVGWLLNEPARFAEQNLWTTLVDESVLVPAHWPNEVANALRRAVRRKRILLKEIRPTLHDLSFLDVRLSAPPGIAEIEALTKDALRLDLSVYDLQYINLARIHQLPLATLDAAMRTAAHGVNLLVLPESV